MQILITHHAIERYVDRIKSNFSFEKARLELLRLINNAEKTGEINNKGQEIWKSRGKDKIKFIIKKDKNKLICVTLVKDREFRNEPEPTESFNIDLTDLLPPHLR